MLRRSGGSVFCGEETTRSPTRISPAVGSTKPAIRRSVVVLPQPEGPSRQTSVPCSIVSETLSTTACGPYCFVNPRNSTDATGFPSNSPSINTNTVLRPACHDTGRRMPRQLPVNTGLRFSMKALRPST